MTAVFYDTTNVEDLATFQGALAGIQAGNANVAGVGTAATSIYNQGGYYALQDTDTGLVSLQKLGDESLFTGSWYDQTTGTMFDFSAGGTGITTASSSSGSTQADSAQTSNGLEDYLFGQGYVVTSGSETSSEGTSSTSTTSSISSSASYVTDDDGNVIEITASDLQDLVDAGIYDNLAEAVEATLDNGYYVSDEEQAKLNLYSDSDETKIQTMMDKYGYTRSEAIASLLGSISDSKNLTQADELKEQLETVQDNQGFIGKAWNGLKTGLESFLGTNVGVTYDDCEYAIEQFEAGDISYSEAQDVIASYQSKQSKATSTIKTGLTAATAAIVGASTGGVGLIAGAITGAAVNTTIGTADRLTNNNSTDDTVANALGDAAGGAVTGAISGVAGTTVKGAKTLLTKAAKATGTSSGIGTKMGKFLKKLF